MTPEQKKSPITGAVAPSLKSEGEEHEPILHEGEPMSQKEKGPISEAKGISPAPTTTKEPGQDTEILAQREKLEEGKAQLEEAYSRMRQFFLMALDDYGETIESHAEQGFYAFPYTEPAEEFGEIAYLSLVLQETRGDMLEKAQRKTGNNFYEYREAAENVARDFKKAMRGLKSNAIKLNGEPWPMSDGKPDMLPICEQMDDMGLRIYTDEDEELACVEAWEEGLLNFKEHWEQYGALCALNSIAGSETLKAVARTEAQDKNRPKKHYDPINKLASELTDGRYFGPDGRTLELGKGKKVLKNRKIKTAVSFSFTGNEPTTISKLSPIDRDVSAAVATWWKAGNRNFTVEQICKTLTGSTKPGKEIIEEVKESLERQRRVLATIDYSDEAKDRGLEADGSKVTSFKIEDHLINAGKVIIETANGKIMEGYQLYSAPVLYQYANITNQVVSYPQEYLETPVSVKTGSVQNTLIKNYLLRRIENMRKNHRAPRKIVFSTIYENIELNTEAKTRAEMKRINDYIERLLALWVKKGILSEYTIEEGPKHSKYAICVKL